MRPSKDIGADLLLSERYSNVPMPSWRNILFSSSQWLLFLAICLSCLCQFSDHCAKQQESSL